MKNIIKVSAATVLFVLAIAFMSRPVDAGIPRGGGDLFKKYTGKNITGIAAGPWSPWRWTSAVQICPNGLWSFDYTRYRTITKTYYLGDRWLAWRWLDWNIVYYEYWKNFQGPFQYSIVQRQMKQVYWFDPFRYDPRIPMSERQVFYRDSLLWADWTRINGIIDPGTGVPVQSHRVFFDEQLYYEDGPHQPDGTDAMVINLANYDAGEHRIRVEATWANGTVSPGFLIVPLATIDYIEFRAGFFHPDLFAGEVNVLPSVLKVTNNLDENRSVIFKLNGRVLDDSHTYADSFFDVFVDVYIPGNGTIVPANSTSFFDVFVAIPPHTPLNTTIEIEIVAMTLVGLHAATALNATADVQQGRVQLDADVRAPRHQLKVRPSVALAGEATLGKLVIEGFGFTPNSNVGLASSARQDSFDIAPNIPTNASGYFRYDWLIPITFKPYGQHTIAAIDLNDGTSATVNATINGPDINNDGKTDIFDLAYVSKYFGTITGLSLPLTAGASAAVLISVGIEYLRSKKKRQNSQKKK